MIQVGSPQNFNGHVGLQGICNEYRDREHYFNALGHTAIKRHEKENNSFVIIENNSIILN